MEKKFVWAIVTCLVVFTLLVTSCGEAATDKEEEVNGGEEVNGEEEEEVNGGEEEEDTTGKDMVLNSAGKLVEKPQYGGWYHTALVNDVRGFDDTITTTPAYFTFTLNLTHDELCTGDWTKGMQGTGEASWTVYTTYFPHLQVGMLATSYEIPDNETIIWHIRQGVHFQDKPPANGRELNAHDIAFNLNRAFTSPGSYLSSTYRQDRDEGPRSITAIDDWTVEMKVPPARQVPILFASNDFVYHHCPEVIEEYGDASDWQNCLGTGAFMLTDYVPVSTITLERNPDYWRNDPLHPDNQLPYLDGVKYFVIPDVATSLAAFRTGKLEARTALVKDDWESLVRTNPDLLWDQSMPTQSACIYMRQDKPELPYDDIRVRKALFYAINHQEIVDEYYGGEAEMICGPVSGIPEYAAMYTTLEEYSEEVQKLYGYYPEEAKELLTNAGYPDGFTATILTSDEGLIPIVKDYWERNLNVTLNIDVKTTAVVNSMLQGGKQEDMYYGAIGGSVLKCNQWRTDTFQNYSKIANEEFNEWFEEFNLEMLDWDKMGAMMKEMEPKMRAQAYFIDLPNDYTYYMWWPWLKSWHGEVSIGYWNMYQEYHYIWVDTELREEMTGISR